MWRKLRYLVSIGQAEASTNAPDGTFGEAGRIFELLAAAWKHANITRQQNLQIFEACVVSKLLHGLESLWLLQEDQNKLNGFYMKSLWRILGMQPSSLSRVSNQIVLQTAGVAPLASKLLQRQLLMLRRIATMPEERLLRWVAFEPRSCEPKRWNYQRRVGRPCLRDVRQHFSGGQIWRTFPFLVASVFETNLICLWFYFFLFLVDSPGRTRTNTYLAYL